MSLDTAASLSVSSMAHGQLQRLLEISTTLSSTLDLNQLLTLVIEVACEMTNSDAGSLLLLDERTGELHFVASSSAGVLDRDVTVPLDGSIAGWIVQNGKPLVQSDVQRDSRHFQGVDDSLQFVTRSILGVPLITRRRVIGALEALNKRDGAEYSDEDLILMQALASQAAIAIENAQLFQQFDLVAEIMHELKTPLMAISASSELLNRQELSPVDHDDLLEIIHKESRRLIKMTQSYLDLARLESRRAALARRAVDLTTLVQEVCQLQQPQAAQRDIRVVMDLVDDLPTLLGDYDRLKQVMLNLVSNAIKYNQDGGVVTVAARAEQDGLIITVTDTGRGIPAKHLDNLFNRFYRVPDSEGYSEGTGLGLTITQRIIEEHDGRIEVSSTLNKGTTFSIWLPTVS